MPHAIGAAATALLLAGATGTAANVPTQLAWHLGPSAHYAVDVAMSHVVSNDLKGILKKLAGSKADPVTILEDRSIAVSSSPGGAVDDEIADVRRYGGVHPKDRSVVRRTTTYKGTISPDGKRYPNGEPLVDAGDGALGEFPKDPVAVGQSWSFSRDVLVDRDLGQGTMTYTDTLTRIDTRGGHRIAIIDVKGRGRVDVAKDLKAKGFQTTDMTLAGTAEFDATSGLPGVQHYTAHAQWSTRVLGVHLGLIFDDTYEAKPWSRKD